MANLFCVNHFPQKLIKQEEKMKQRNKRRLTSKLACFQSRNIVNSYLALHQLGVATKLEPLLITIKTVAKFFLN
jgi:hypothetical protein